MKEYNFLGSNCTGQQFYRMISTINSKNLDSNPGFLSDHLIEKSPDLADSLTALTVETF
jgi:hypothetical protein